MSALTVILGSETKKRLEATRDRLVLGGCTEVVKNALSIYLPLMPKVSTSPQEFCLRGRVSQQVVCIVGMTYTPPEPTPTEATCVVVPQNDILTIAFDAVPVDQLRKVAAKLDMPMTDVIHEACRLYIYIVPRILDEDLVFGIIEGTDFRPIIVPGLDTADTSLSH